LQNAVYATCHVVIHGNVYAQNGDVIVI